MNKNTARKFFNKFAKKILPPKPLAFLDFYFNINPRDEYGGAFNGQSNRKEVFLEIKNAILLEAIVETGSHRGSTTEFFLSQFGLGVYSVEIIPENYYYTTLRLKAYKNDHIILGDSTNFLRGLAENRNFPKKRVFFYLDAHGMHYIPLWEEIDIILKAFSESIIMIDDFQVADDPGYGFDEYGPGNAFTFDELMKHDFNMELFFPAAHSSSETGKRRGCAVLVTKDLMLDSVKILKGLRHIEKVSLF